MLSLCVLQIRMDLKHLKTKSQKAAAKHKAETENLQVCRAVVTHQCVANSCLQTGCQFKCNNVHHTCCWLRV
jgi:hypothetical protein